MVLVETDNSNVNSSSNEVDEVLLNQGDGILDAGLLTKAKNSVCYIYYSKEETEKLVKRCFINFGIYSL